MSRRITPYGMGAGDYPCCCPGHDKYSSDTYNNNRSKKAHTEMTKKLHRRGRKKMKHELTISLDNSFNTCYG